MQGLRFSRRVEGMEESQTMAFASRARELRDSGVDVISMTAGEPDFTTVDRAKDAGVGAITGNFTRYAPARGIPELLTAIQRKFREENGLEFAIPQLSVTTGAKQAVANALFTVCDEGDEVLLPGPCWVSYTALVRLAGGVPVVVLSGIEKGFRPDIDALRRAVTPRTRAMVLNSPNNPTGIVYTRDELEAIAAIARDHNLIIISDEVYESMLFDDARHISIGTLETARDRTVTVSGVSKTHAMTGWRIGFLGGPEALVSLAVRVQGHLTSSANSIAQKAAAAALTGGREHVTAMREEFQRRRDLALPLLRGIPGIDVLCPEGAMFFFFSVRQLLGRKAGGRTLRSATDLVEYLLEVEHVGLIPGGGFGDDTCIRLSFACPPADLEKGIARIDRAFRSILAAG